MARDFAVEPVNKVRRADRAVEDDAWIRAMLHHAAVGTVATVYEGQPFVNANLFVYDEPSHTIFMHTARLGRTQANITRDEKVCFTVNTIGRLLPADIAFEFSVEYSGVVVFGRGSIIAEEEQAMSALQLLLNKYFPHLKPGRDYRPPVHEEMARTAVYAIQIHSWSGKKKEVAPDFPGAFYYPYQDTN